MKGRKFFLTLLMTMLCGVTGVQAQESQSSPDGEKRMVLARKMHELKPTSQQVESAISRAAEKFPESERAAFKAGMMRLIDQKKLEDLSVKAMADIFTVAELERMVSYFSSDEARSISEKMPKYQGIIQPEIIKMLDAAMIQARTGGPGITTAAGEEKKPQ